MSNQLSLQVYDVADLSSGLWIDWSTRASGISSSTGPHGFERMSGQVAAELTEALSLIDRLPGKHIVLSSGDTAWEGRLEDISLTSTGIRFTALGYWRALADVVYTALWSDQDLSANWKVGTRDDRNNWFNERWELDNVDRLYWGVREGERYGSFGHRGVWVYRAPNTTEPAQKINEIDYTYDYDLPTDWRVLIVSRHEHLGGATVEHTYTSTSSNDTGTNTVTLSADRPILSIEVFNASGSAVDYSRNTGKHYAKITAMRVKGSTSASIYGDEIADALVTHITAENSDQLNAATVLIQSQALDLTDEIYMDMLPADILTHLASLGDDQTPPRVWEVGVWENQVLHLQPVCDKAKEWYADITELELSISLDNVVNKAYGLFKTPGGRAVRTASSSDTFSQTRYGITRNQAARADTTAGTQARAARDVFIEEGKDAIPRGSFSLEQVYDGAGASWPLWMIRSGDTVTLRNIPAVGSDLVDKITRFRVGATEYDVDQDTLRVVPEFDLPQLAQQLGGLL